MSGLFLDSQYQDRESIAIAQLGVDTGYPGQALAHIKNRRSLQEFRDWLQWNRQFEHAMHRRRPRWCDPY